MTFLAPHGERIEKYQVSRIPLANIVGDVSFSVRFRGNTDFHSVGVKLLKRQGKNPARIELPFVKFDTVLSRRRRKPLCVQGR